MWGLGRNSSGQLGIKDLENKHIPTLIELRDRPVIYSCGFSHTVVAC